MHLLLEVVQCIGCLCIFFLQILAVLLDLAYQLLVLADKIGLQLLHEVTSLLLGRADISQNLIDLLCQCLQLCSIFGNSKRTIDQLLKSFALSDHRLERHGLHCFHNPVA